MLQSFGIALFLTRHPELFGKDFNSNSNICSKISKLYVFTNKSKSMT